MKHTIIGVVALVILIIGVYAVYVFQQGQQNNAVDACIRAASTQNTVASEGRNSITSEPNADWYEQCMRDKGYR